MRVSIIDEVIYAMRIMPKLKIMANGIDFFGSFASSPVVAMISNPIKA